MKVPFFRLSSGKEEIENVTSVINSGWLTTGKWARELESNFADHCGVKHALAVNSCTAALHLSVEALGIGPGDKVLVPSLTFTASAEVIRYVGADPVFLDVDPETLLLRPDDVDRAFSKDDQIKAMIVVHFGGQSAQLDGVNGLLNVSKKHGVRIIQDAAHAFPAEDTYGPVGSVGDITCFSFYANKTITSGEGGMLVTNDEDVAHRVKLMRLHGIDRDVWDRFVGSRASSWVYDVKAPGFKYNMPDLNAAVAVAQFRKAGRFRDQRAAIVNHYREAFCSLSGVRLLHSRVPDKSHSHHLFPIVLGDGSKCSRDEFIEAMAEKGIGTSVHYRPLHRMTYYRNRYRLDERDFPNTESYWKGCVSLPVYPAMSQAELEYVIRNVKELLA